MIDEMIFQFLDNKPPQLNFKGLIRFMVSTNIVFKHSKLVSSAGMTTLDCICLDIEKLSRYSDSKIFFVILHEICHSKRMSKLGREEIIKRLSSEDFYSFNINLIQEEIIADRYARSLFLKFNGLPFPKHMTQELYLPENQVKYVNNMRHFFGKVQHDEKKYYKMIDNYILA